MSFKMIQGAAENTNVDITGTITEIIGVDQTAKGKLRTKCKVSDGSETHNVSIYNTEGVDPSLLNRPLPMSIGWFRYSAGPAAGKVGYSGFIQSDNVQPQQRVPQQPAPQPAFPKQTTGGYPNVNQANDRDACIVRQCAGKVAAAIVGPDATLETFFKYVEPINEWMLTGKSQGVTTGPIPPAQDPELHPWPTDSPQDDNLPF